MQFLMDPQQNQHPPPPPPPPPQPHPQAAAQPLTQAPPVQLMFQQPPVLVAPPPPQQQEQQHQHQQEVQVSSAPAGGVAPAPPAPGQPQIQQFTQVAANPTPVTLPVGNHPPYAQMITEAIAALNEKDGSSKRAIAGYIERVYANSLPLTHSALLTNHLKRLKDQGLIEMVKHSYKLPGPPGNAAPPPARSPAGDPFPPANPTSNGIRRRGRPPKVKNPIPVSSVPPLSTTTGRVDPAAFPVPVHNPPVSNSVANTDTASVFVSLGLADGPIPVPVSVGDPSPGPRRRGRPKKTELSGGAPPALQATATLAKKSPGRPRKVAAKNAVNAAGVAGTVGSNFARVQFPKLKKDGTPMKPRGRPPRKAVPVPVTDASVPVPGATGATIAPAVYVGEGALTTVPAPVPAVGVKKRRGRPPTKAPRVQNGPKRIRKLSGKPLGRPRKSAPKAAVQGGASTQQIVPYDEMKKKLELYQFKIKQTVGALKPCLDGNSNAGALNALKELEELANVVDPGAPATTVPVQQQPPVQS